MSLLELDRLTCHFPTRAGLVRAVDGVDLALDAGETFALVGESGCGKSTLAKLVLGLHRPTAGSIRFDGVDIATMDRRTRHAYRSRVQAVFQDPYSSLNPRLRVRTILTEPLGAHGVGRRERARRVDEALDLVGLPRSAAALYPHEFSGGQRQRIAIARALILRPELIVLDEPISALDVSIRAQILNLLSDLQADLGLTYLLIAHDLALVEHAAKRVGVMYLGQIVEHGPAEQVFAAPGHPYTETLLAAVPHPDPRRPRAALPISGEVASPLNPPSGCRFHPRCRYAKPTCAVEDPPFATTATAQVRCVLAVSNSSSSASA